MLTTITSRIGKKFPVLAPSDGRDSSAMSFSYTRGSAWQVATVRALVSAVIVGALAFLAIWAQTDDPKTLIIASLTPALTTFGARLGLEGTVDARRETGS